MAFPRNLRNQNKYSFCFCSHSGQSPMRNADTVMAAMPSVSADLLPLSVCLLPAFLVFARAEQYVFMPFPDNQSKFALRGRREIKGLSMISLLGLENTGII